MKKSKGSSWAGSPTREEEYTGSPQDFGWDIVSWVVVLMVSVGSLGYEAINLSNIFA